MDDGTDRHRTERHGITGLHVDRTSGHDGVADCEPLRCQNIGLLTVRILDESDVSSTIGVIFEPLDGSGDIKLVALEIDQPIGPLVAATLAPRRDPAEIAAPARLDQAFGQKLDRGALPQMVAIDQHHMALAGARRIVCLECHDDLLKGPWSHRASRPRRA